MKIEVARLAFSEVMPSAYEPSGCLWNPSPPFRALAGETILSASGALMTAGSSGATGAGAVAAAEPVNSSSPSSSELHPTSRAASASAFNVLVAFIQFLRLLVVGDILTGVSSFTSGRGVSSAAHERRARSRRFHSSNLPRFKHLH